MPQDTQSVLMTQENYTRLVGVYLDGLGLTVRVSNLCRGIGGDGGDMSLCLRTHSVSQRHENARLEGVNLDGLGLTVRVSNLCSSEVSAFLSG